MNRIFKQNLILLILFILSEEIGFSLVSIEHDDADCADFHGYARILLNAGANALGKRRTGGTGERISQNAKEEDI